LDATVLAELAALELPLPSARLKLEADDPLRGLVDAVLGEEGLELRQMQVKGIREMFFSRGERAALCRPGETQSESAEDEQHPGKRKVMLAFELPRGSYATLVIKRIQSAV
ncbi:MAG: tRNA pseudouridine(13) synthase TruD, partial [Gemmataceae bacterium]|nr:tRNA pseudouridine(13) synthase TruD [Gemmataceae bacterium]